ncbi:MAG: MFS transporter [Micromonosporaceae bacterium]|nr:MFS transporter [Micromonosporaceae bacterium]
MAGTLLGVSQLYLTVPLLPDIATRHQVSQTTAALVGTGFGAAYAAGNLIFPTLSDRFDPRLLMAAGLVGCALAAMVCGWSDTFAVLVAARVAQGLAAAALPPVALTAVGILLPPQDRAAGIAGVSSCFFLGGIVGQGYALGMERSLGWSALFTWLTLPLAICAAALWLLPAPPAAGRGPAQGLIGLLARFGTLLRRPPLLATYLCALAPLLTFVALYSALNEVAAARFGIDEPAAQLALRLPGLPGIALGAAAGVLITRAGPYRTGGIAFLVSASGMIAMALAGSLGMLLAGSAVYVAGLAVAVPSVIAAVGMASGDARGVGIAGYTFLIGLGGAAAPPLAAALGGASFTTLMIVLASALVLSAISIGLGPRATVQQRPGGLPLRERDAEQRVDAVGHQRGR